VRIAPLTRPVIGAVVLDPIAWRAGGSATVLQIIGNVAGFLATGIGEIRIRLRMVAAVADLTIDEMHYPLTNEFFGFQRTATGGQYVLSDGSPTPAVYNYDWAEGEVLTISIFGDGETMQIGRVNV